MSGWQPIETAPKDGTEIVVISNGDSWIVRYTTVGRPPGVGGWRIKALPGRDPIAYIEATHWCPLPDPPTEPERATPSEAA